MLTLSDKLNIRLCLKSEIRRELNYLRNNRDFYGADYCKSVVSRLRDLNHTCLKIRYHEV